MKVNSQSLALILLMESNATVYGINIELKMIKDFVKLALKMKKIKFKAFIKTLILISCLIAKEPVNKKVCRFKRLSTVQ